MELTESSEGIDWFYFHEAGCKTSLKPALNIWEAPPWPALVSESILKHPCGYSATTPEPMQEKYRLRLHGMN